MTCIKLINIMVSSYIHLKANFSQMLIVLLQNRKELKWLQVQWLKMNNTNVFHFTNGFFGSAMLHDLNTI